MVKEAQAVAAQAVEREGSAMEREGSAAVREGTALAAARDVTAVAAERESSAEVVRDGTAVAVGREATAESQRKGRAARDGAAVRDGGAREKNGKEPTDVISYRAEINACENRRGQDVVGEGARRSEDGSGSQTTPARRADGQWQQVHDAVRNVHVFSTGLR